MSTKLNWQATLAGIGDKISENGAISDETDAFPQQNYQLLKEHKLFSALVPEELGGGGLGFNDMCALLRQLASYHPSTALSFSMHQHIIAANHCNYLQGRPGQALLEKVAANELMLVSTGAGDWLASCGELNKVDGGYQFSGFKHFASGSVAGNLLVTSAPYQDPEEGWQVLHFPVPLNGEGVTVLDNWKAMGMRGTGSNSVKLENVFVPEQAIVVRRPRGDFHAMWSVILPVALTLIMSVYRGIAETAAQRARERCKAKTDDPTTPYLLGEMENALTMAQVTVDSMIDIVDNFAYQPNLDTTNEIVKRKTIAVQATRTAAEKAVEACGGQGFLRPNGIESLWRDVQAGQFHPMQEKRQLLFTGSLAMGVEPPGQAF